MKPVSFEYFAPTERAEVLSLLQQYGDEAKVLAGGQSLMPLMNMRLVRPKVVVDINRIPGLEEIAPDSDSSLNVGARTRHRTLERSELIRERLPLVAAAMPHVAHSQIRTRGTIGGSLVHADPAAELPALCLALEAQLILGSVSGERSVPVADFLIDYLTTAIGPEELLTEIRIPPWDNQWRWGFQEVCQRHGDFALVGSAILLRIDQDRNCQDARIAMFGVGGKPTRVTQAEDSLKGQRLDDSAIKEAGLIVADQLEAQSDMHASAKYRQDVGGVVARRALAMALGDDGRGNIT
ncbi:MAG: FAD binding domain-containing protein [Dehalococcoidia bacterium]